MPEFARLKRFGVAEQRNTAERVFTREEVGTQLGFFFLFRTFSFFLLLSKKKEKVHCKTKNEYKFKPSPRNSNTHKFVLNFYPLPRRGEWIIINLCKDTVILD